MKQFTLRPEVPIGLVSVIGGALERSSVDRGQNQPLELRVDASPHRGVDRDPEPPARQADPAGTRGR